MAPEVWTPSLQGPSRSKEGGGRDAEFSNNHEVVFNSCAEGKHTRGHFPSSVTKTSDVLQLIHSDLSGMLPVTSLRRYLYYFIFVDDFSHKTWIYFLKKKDEVFKWFCDFKALVENQTRNKIKILRTENGTEYESNEFNDFCREVSINRETYVAYTLEKNGVIQRNNLMIMEATRAMLDDLGLPKFL